MRSQEFYPTISLPVNPEVFADRGTSIGNWDFPDIPLDLQNPCGLPPDYNSQTAWTEALEEYRSDCLTLALRLLDEEEDTFSPETRAVMGRWRPICERLLSTPC